jgi:hypothetical protein
VALVRDRATLNRMPRLIGAMSRESRPDWLQRQRKDELMKRLSELIQTHGQHNRSIEGYAADLKAKYGIDIQRFLDAIASQIEQGRSVDQAVNEAAQALRNDDAAGFQRAIQQAETGQTSPPPAGMGQGRNSISGVSVDPNNPSQLLIRFADGSTVSVPFTRGPNGELIFTLPNGEQVVLPAQAGPGGVTMLTLPNGSQVQVSGIAAPGGGGTGGAGAGGGALPPGVRQVNPTTLAVTMPDGTERYFPADLTKPGIGTRYLGERGTRLIEETEEFLDLAGAGQYQIRQGRSLKWQFMITPTGEQADAGGTRASFKFADRLGQGKFAVTGWRILQLEGGQVASGMGDEASGIVTQSGTYRVEFSGLTEWGSPFRIEAQVQIAVQ